MNALRNARQLFFTAALLLVPALAFAVEPPPGGWDPPLTQPNQYVYIGNNRPGLDVIEPRPAHIMSAYERYFGQPPPPTEIMPDGSARFTFATNNLGSVAEPESAVWYAHEVHGGRTVYVVPSEGAGYQDPRALGHYADTPGGGSLASEARQIRPAQEWTVDGTGRIIERRFIRPGGPVPTAEELVAEAAYTPRPTTGARLAGAASTALEGLALGMAAWSGIRNTGNLANAYLDPAGTRAAFERGDMRVYDLVPFLGGNPAFELVNGIVSPIYDDFANADGILGTLGALAMVPGRILDGAILTPASGLADLGIHGLAHGFAAAGNAFCWLTGLCSPNLCVVGTAGCQPRGGSNGDPHLVSFDGHRYDMQGVGEFIAATDGEGFMVQARQQPWRGSTIVAVNTALAMQVGTDRVSYYLGDPLPFHVGGVPTAITGARDLDGGGRIEAAAGVFDVYWPTGERVHVKIGRDHLDYAIAPVQSQVGRLHGLLGDLDGDPNNDFMTRSGEVLSAPTFIDLYNLFARGWRVTDAESLFDYAPGQSTLTFTDLDFPRQPIAAADLDAADRDAARAQCLAAGVTDPEVLAGCVLDVGVTGEGAFAESSAGVPPAAAVTVSACPVTGPVVAYGEGGFRYRIGGELPLGWDQPDFDDSGWDRSVGALGDASCGPAGLDPWATGTEAIVRLRFELADACGLELGFLLDGAIVEARLNGTSILPRAYFHESCARRDSLVLHPPLDTWRTGVNVLAVRLRAAPGGFASYDQRVNLGSFAPDAGVACGTTDTTCDGIDDDCDGNVDQGFAPFTTTCGTGACAASAPTTCVFGRLVSECTPGAPAASDATCDGIDDDCDGAADEEFVSIATTCGAGVCASTGATSCVSGRIADSCAPGQIGASDDDCDGLDDDCDGVADDGYVPVATTCGAGLCARAGVTSCVRGAVQDSCTPGTPAATDATCDGLDDDCDGAADEDYVTRDTTCGAGTCTRGGRTSCQGGVERDSCVAGTPVAGDVCAPPSARPGLFARVFTGFASYTGAIAHTRVDAFLNLGAARDWSFRSGTLTTNFSVVWAGNIVIPASGAYVFGTTSDDGSLVRIDGANVVNNNFNNGQSATFRSGTVNLTAGVHRIEVFWTQGSGGGGIELYWQPPGQERTLLPRDVLSHEPADCFEPAPTSGGYCGTCGGSCEPPETRPGLYRELRNNGFAVYTGAVDQTRIDPEVSYGARSGWAWRPNNRVTNFTVTWEGFVRVPSSGNWRFGTTSDDGSAIHLDGDWVTNNNFNNGQSPTFRDGGVWLAEGLHRIKVLYTQGSGGAGIELAWRAPGSSSAVLIPRSALFHAPDDCRIAPAHDPSNCGACNRACAEGDVCDETGACVAERAGGLSRTLYSGFATYSGTPVATRIDPEVSFGAREAWSWSPHGLTGNFSTTWNGWLLVPETGQYALGTTSSAGSAVYVDTDWVLNNNLDNGQSPTYREQAVWLEAGAHRLRVVHTAGIGGAGIELYWTRPGQARASIPPENLFHLPGDCTRAGELDPLSCGACGVVCAAGAACTPDGTCSDQKVPGLYRKLYAGFATYQGTPVATGADLEIAFGAARSWLWTPNKLTSNWSAVWDGYVDAPADGLYTIGTTSDDGSGVFVDTDLVLNNNLSNGQSPTYRQRTTYLRAGPHRIRVLYTNGTGGRGIELGWTTPLGVSELIPAARLWHLASDRTPPLPEDPSAVTPIPGGLSGTFYDGFATYAGTPIGTTVDAVLDYGAALSWTYRPFGRSANVSAVWTGYLSIPADGTYELGTTSKDGSGLWLPLAGVFLDNNLDNGQSPTYRSTSAFLRAGLHPIEVRWTHGSANGGVELRWRTPGAAATAIVPSAQLFR